MYGVKINRVPLPMFDTVLYVKHTVGYHFLHFCVVYQENTVIYMLRHTIVVYHFLHFLPHCQAGHPKLQRLRPPRASRSPTCSARCAQSPTLSALIKYICDSDTVNTVMSSFSTVSMRTMYSPTACMRCFVCSKQGVHAEDAYTHFSLNEICPF